MKKKTKTACNCVPGFPCKHRQIRDMEERKSGARTPIKNLKERSQAQERGVAQSYREAGFEKARRIPMSGAIQTLPADVDPGELLLVECKETRTGKLVVEPEWLKKLEREALESGRPGCYALHGWVAEGETIPYKKFVVVSEPLWMRIIAQYHATTESGILDS